MVSELGVESTVSMVGYVEGVTADDVGKSGPFDMGSMDVAIRPFGFAGVRPLEVGTTISLVGDYNNDDGLEEQESTDTRPHPPFHRLPVYRYPPQAPHHQKIVVQSCSELMFRPPESGKVEAR